MDPTGPPPPIIPTSVEIVILVSCVLSFLGSFLLIITYVTWPDLRTKPRQLLVFLSVTDLLSAVSYFYGVLMNFEHNSWDCIAQGAVSTFANTSSFFWTVAVAIYLYMVIVKADKRAADSLVVWFHLTSWCVPLVITVAAVALKKIGYDASSVSVGWCWVSIAADDYMLWMLLTGKVWEFIAYITLPVLYILIKIHIHTAHTALAEYRPLLVRTSSYQSRSSIADKKLTFIPIVFIILRIWSTVRFILAITYSPAVWNPVLIALHGIGNTFQGGANCIMFVLCTEVIRSRLLSCLCCCCRYGSYPVPDLSRQTSVNTDPWNRERIESLPPFLSRE